MPDTIADVTPATGARYAFQFVDLAGNLKSATLSLPGLTTPPTAGQITTLRQAAGNASNAALIKVESTAISEVNAADPGVVTFDEAYSAVNSILRMVFQNPATRQLVEFEIPAPDTTLLQTDRVTFNTTTGGTLLAALQGVLDTAYGAGVYVYQRGYVSGRSLRAPRPKVLPGAFQEPGPTGIPGEGTGIEPV